MQWLLPVIAKPAAPLAEGEEAAGAEEGGGGGGGDADEGLGAQGAEASKQRKLELMKTSIDVKYVSGWAAFVQKMTDFIFFYNTGAYEHSTSLHVAAGAEFTCCTGTKSTKYCGFESATRAHTSISHRFM